MRKIREVLRLSHEVGARRILVTRAVGLWSRFPETMPIVRPGRWMNR